VTARVACRKPGRPQLTSRPATTKHRTAGGTGTDPGAHPVAAARRAVAALLFARPPGGGGDRVTPDAGPVVAEEVQQLFTDHDARAHVRPPASCCVAPRRSATTCVRSHRPANRLRRGHGG